MPRSPAVAAALPIQAATHLARPLPWRPGVGGVRRGRRCSRPVLALWYLGDVVGGRAGVDPAGRGRSTGLLSWRCWRTRSPGAAGDRMDDGATGGAMEAGLGGHPRVAARNHVLPFRLGEALRCVQRGSSLRRPPERHRRRDRGTTGRGPRHAPPDRRGRRADGWHRGDGAVGRGGDCRQPARHRVAGVAAVRPEVADRQPVSRSRHAWRLPPSARGCSRPRCSTPWPPQPPSITPADAVGVTAVTILAQVVAVTPRRRRHLRGGGHRRARGPRDRRTGCVRRRALRRMRSRPRTASPSGRSRW